jgi:transcription antitermination factor NusG
MMITTEIDTLEPPVDVTDDREARSKFWIAIYTRPKSEKKAAYELGKTVNTYVATQTITKQWSDRKKRIESVVVPMVIFAEVSSDEEISFIKRHPLVLKILTWPGQKTVAHIPSKQIENFKFMLSVSDRPVEFIQGNYRLSDHVRVVRGPLSGLEGTIDKTLDGGNTFIIIAIGILGGAKVSVDNSDLELINCN